MNKQDQEIHLRNLTDVTKMFELIRMGQDPREFIDKCDAYIGYVIHDLQYELGMLDDVYHGDFKNAHTSYQFGNSNGNPVSNKLGPNFHSVEDFKPSVGDGLPMTSMEHPEGLIDKFVEAIQDGRLSLKQPKEEWVTFGKKPETQEEAERLIQELDRKIKQLEEAVNDN